jgi:hypothetical protein
VSAGRIPSGVFFCAEFNQPLNEKVEEKFKHKADGAHRRSAML